MRVKRFICMIIACVMMITFAGQPCEALAAGKSVSELKKDRGIKWLTENMCFYASMLYCINQYEAGKKVTIKMDTTHKFEVAGWLADAKYKKFDLEDNWSGSDGFWARLDTKFISGLYKKLFGTKLVQSKIQKNLTSIKYKDGKYYGLVGDFGMAQPAYRIVQITKKGNGIYQIKAKNKLKGDGINETIGTTWITVKKDKKAAYGYRVIKCAYKIMG